MIARVVDAKDPVTSRHSERVAAIAVRLAVAVGWSPKRCAQLHEAGLVHDVGKIGVPDAILFKPGALTEAEFAEIRKHAALGAAIVAEVLSPEQTLWVRGHHERLDGAGYPDHLTADQISDGAAILALADSWDVMTVARPYSTPISKEQALEECRRGAGHQFFPELVRVLERVLEADGDAPLGGWAAEAEAISVSTR